MLELETDPAPTREIAVDEIPPDEVQVIDRFHEPGDRTWLPAIAGVLALMLVLVVGALALRRLTGSGRDDVRTASTTRATTTTAPAITTTTRPAPTTTQPLAPTTTFWPDTAPPVKVDASGNPVISPSPQPPGEPAARSGEAPAAAPEAAAPIPDREAPAPAPPPAAVKELDVDVALNERARSGEEQRVLVKVEDERERPVAGASVEIVVHYPGGVEERFQAPATDENGSTAEAFTVRQVKRGTRVEVEVKVSFGERENTEKASWKPR